jgi:tetratricopeptide (TPR) repeat protein
MSRRLVFFVAALVFQLAAATQAQEAVLLQLYDKGVHEYFSGDYTKAFNQLTAAITAGSRDPRVYYYRGLSYLKFGRTAEAEADFRKAAQLESRDVNKYYNVGKALERVQGTDRQLLETYRVQARIAAYKESERVRKARYEAIRREEARVLQQQAAEGAAAEAGTSSETVPTPTPEAAAAEPAAETKANPPAAEEDKKAGMGAEAATESGSPDPFAAKASEEKKPAAETEPTAEQKPSPEAKPTGKSILGKLLKRAEGAAGKAGP